MKSPQVISGQALVGDEFSLEPVDIVVESGMITGIETNPRAPPVWICPAFFNAHTHLGDTVAMDYPAQGSLEELVTPPDGIKHRLHTFNNRPCEHQGPDSEPGQFYDCVIGTTADPDIDLMYDHDAGARARFHVRATR